MSRSRRPVFDEGSPVEDEDDEVGDYELPGRAARRQHHAAPATAAPAATFGHGVYGDGVYGDGVYVDGASTTSSSGTLYDAFAQLGSIISEVVAEPRYRSHLASGWSVGRSGTTAGMYGSSVEEDYVTGDEEYDDDRESGVEPDMGETTDDSDSTSWLRHLCEESSAQRAPQCQNVARLKAEKDEGRTNVICLYRNNRFQSDSSDDDCRAEQRDKRPDVTTASRCPRATYDPDCVVIIGEAVFPCSRRLLDRHSTYLTHVPGDSVIYLPDEFVSPAGFEKLYAWMERGGDDAVFVDPGDAREVLDAAEFLGAKVARHACLRFLSRPQPSAPPEYNPSSQPFLQ